MTDVQWFALLNAAGVVFVLLIQRRVVVSWSTIGVFCVTNFVVVQIGILALPFGWELADQFGFDLSLLDHTDLQLAIILNVWGAGIILVSYHLTHIVFNRGRALRRAPNLLTIDLKHLPLGFAVRRLLLISSVAMLFVGLYAASHLGPFLAGIREGFLEGSNVAVIAARYAVGADYALLLAVFNVLPFLGAALWLTCRLRGGYLLKLYTMVYCAIAAILLLLTFQKRSLLVFLCTLLLVNLGTHEEVVERKRNRFSLPRIVTWLATRARLIGYGAIPLTVLMALYLLQGSIGRADEDIVSSLGSLVQAAGVTLIGGLSLPAALYAHYYPAIEPHYGFRAIGLVANIFGFEVYPMTVLVFQYFSPGSEFGSVSIGAVTDFYGAFGLGGWLIGTCLLGVTFNRIDSFLFRRKATASRLLLTVFVFVTVYYLSNASVNNALLGYGGGIFVVLWALLVLRMKPSLRSQHVDSAAMISGA